MAKSVQISVVIIAFNEERNIGRCIDSVEDIADEVLVVDSNSTDATRSISEEKGARVLLHDFTGHIEQKNWAASQAKYDHILSLDADEALDHRLRHAIVEVKKHWTSDGYSMNRLTNFCGQWIKHGGWYPDKKLRLWDRSKGIWTGDNPHDQFQMEPNSVITHLSGDILHYSYYEIGDHISQINYFSDISAKALYKKGKRSDLIQIYFRPKFAFFTTYILKLGFMDGYYGWIIARNTAHSVFLKYTKLKELQRKG